MSPSGSLALVFDDGYASDLDLLAPVLDDRNAPACFAIPAENVGEPGYLTAEQVRELDAAGHEVVAHGRRHRRLESLPLAGDVEAGDERVPVDGEIFPDEDHGLYAGDEYELTDGDRAVTVEVAEKGRVDGDPAVTVAEPLATGFPAGDAVLRPSESTLRDEIVGGGEDLRALGVDVDSFVFPYDAVDARGWRIAADAYDAIPNARPGPLPTPPGTPATSLSRHYLETDWLTRAGIADYLDAVPETDGLGILAGHSEWDTVTAERVGFVLDAARERDVAVRTVRSAVGQLRERAARTE